MLRHSGNALLVALFTLLAIASFDRYLQSRSLQAFSVLAVNSLFLGLFLIRRPAKDETRSPALWALAFAGTAMPLFMRPTASPGGPTVGPWLEVLGATLLIAALLSLRRSFAVAPGNRGIQRGGMYRLVRHPVYLAELTLLFGVVLANPSPVNGVLWVCACALQFARATAEERFLAADPLYSAYCSQVRYRFIPGLL